jgi:lipoate-protein ligase A
MNDLDLTLPSPAENLACDEALLDQAEAEGGPEVLRFWESPSHFVVLGYANKVREEVDMEACRSRGIPILRRCSGGGTVLQGPGCLNYSVILRIGGVPELQSISTTNRFVMERNRSAVAAALGVRPSSGAAIPEVSSARIASDTSSSFRVSASGDGGPPSPVAGSRVTIEGHTDLAVGGLKFSGNAQRRKRDWLLFHGTFLLKFDLGLIAELLLPPPRQPEYRKGRTHAAFLTQLKLPANAVKSILRDAWRAKTPQPEVPCKRIARLVAEKYSREEWNLSR